MSCGHAEMPWHGLWGGAWAGAGAADMGPPQCTWQGSGSSSQWSEAQVHAAVVAWPFHSDGHTGPRGLGRRLHTLSNGSNFVSAFLLQESASSSPSIGPVNSVLLNVSHCCLPACPQCVWEGGVSCTPSLKPPGDPVRHHPHAPGLPWPLTIVCRSLGALRFLPPLRESFPFPPPTSLQYRCWITGFHLHVQVQVCLQGRQSPTSSQIFIEG